MKRNEVPKRPREVQPHCYGAWAVYDFGKQRWRYFNKKLVRYIEYGDIPEGKAYPAILRSWSDPHATI
jgi:hypothetical protein